MTFHMFLSLALVAVAAGGPPSAAAAEEPTSPVGSRARPRGETRDVMLLLDTGPLHLRFHVSLGGRPLPELREAYIDRLFRTLDADGDGKLSREETARSPLLRKPQRDAARQFLDSLGTPQTVTRRDVEQTVQRVGGETVVYRQDLASADNDVQLFQFLDEDSSGLLDIKEIAAAVARILEKDADNDQCISFQELLPPPAEPDPQLEPGVVELEVPEVPTVTISTLLRDTREQLLPLRLVRLYDRNRDRQLSQREIGWDSDRFALLDTSGDGRLDTEELIFIEQTPVDLELAVDLDPGDTGAPAIEVLHASGKEAEVIRRPDFVKIEFAGAAVTFTRRYLDPVASSLENAMLQFNLMDQDANGYLEKEETAQRIRFARGLFEAIDFDGDGKIFGEEMEQYVRVRGEPAATSCRVNLFDTGHGFFMALDRNGDGRIGVRERRNSVRSLAMMERDGRQGLSAREPIRHFHVEFVRGSYQMFGPVDPLAAQSPAFEQRAAVGPIWFQRMDRNGDGDLSWDEFLGPRDVFNQLDVDHDTLIDPDEAAAAEALFQSEGGS